jgi:hypothetical protein
MSIFIVCSSDVTATVITGEPVVDEVIAIVAPSEAGVDKFTVTLDELTLSDSMADDTSSEIDAVANPPSSVDANAVKSCDVFVGETVTDSSVLIISPVASTH